VSEQQIAQEEPWPLYDKWWLGIYSEPYEKFPENFDQIRIEAQGPDGFVKVIDKLMVPKIDGLICQSHSFIGSLIHQNLEAERAKVNVLVEAIQAEIKILDAAELSGCVRYLKEALKKVGVSDG